MVSNRCKTCAWFDNQHDSLKLITPIPGRFEIGYCRKHRPSVFFVNQVYWGGSPIMDANDLCGEYRKDEGN